MTSRFCEAHNKSKVQVGVQNLVVIGPVSSEKSLPHTDRHTDICVTGVTKTSWTLIAITIERKQLIVVSLTKRSLVYLPRNYVKKSTQKKFKIKIVLTKSKTSYVNHDIMLRTQF